MIPFYYLSPNLKKSSTVNFKDHFVRFIRNFYDEDPTKYTDSLIEFNQLREISCVLSPDKHETSLDVMFRYYDQICVIDSKLPISEQQIPIKFSWNDAFNTGSFLSSCKKYSAIDIIYEKCSILFNIAALQSQIAKSQSLESDEGLKSACKFFQGSAGTFIRLRDDVYKCFKSVPTPDIAAETTSALSTLMIAQAQETFYHKAFKDKMNDNVSAKLAHQTSDFYADALSLMQTPSIKSQWEKDWIPIISSKQFLFHAIAEYLQSKVCISKQSIGEAISRLKKSLTLLEDSQKRSENLLDLKSIIGACKNLYEKSLKDNQLIYSERIPDYSTLEPIGKAIVSKPTPFTSPQSNFIDLFSQLKPIVIVQALQLYENKKCEMINSELAIVRESNHDISKQLSSLNLPASLENNSGTGIPPTLIEKSRELISKGGYNKIVSLLENLPELLSRNKELISETVRILDSEDLEDGKVRAKYCDRWSRMPSAQLSAPLRADISKYQGILSNAILADKKVRDSFEEHKQSIIILSYEENELARCIPSCGVYSSSESVLQITDKLKKLCLQVDEIKTQRNIIETSLKSNSQSPEFKFLENLSENSIIDEETIINNHLTEIYGAIQNEIKDSLTRQKDLLIAINSCNLEFLNHCQKGEDAINREQILKELLNGYDAFIELIANLQEGSKFYADLTNLLLKLQQRANDLVFARKTELDDLIKDLEKAIGNNNQIKPEYTNQIYAPQIYQTNNDIVQSSFPIRPDFMHSNPNIIPGYPNYHLFPNLPNQNANIFPMYYPSTNPQTNVYTYNPYGVYQTPHSTGNSPHRK